MNEKIYVTYEGGTREAFDPPFACNYMLANTENAEGDIIELYAEFSVSRDSDAETLEKYGLPVNDKGEIDFIVDEELSSAEQDQEFFDFIEKHFDIEKFDEDAETALKEEIIQQAKENGIDPERLIFPN